jgi:hypothetical protein
MKKLFFAFIAVLSLSAFLLAGCGGGEAETKKAPVYPACEETAQCADHNQHCVSGTCKDCGTSAHCKPCNECQAGKCVKMENCCRSDKDCGADQNCIRKPGKKSGTCKTK